jgi:hypothetical protein
MTRKDYELIAATLNAQALEYRSGTAFSHDDDVALEALLRIANSVADALTRDNPRFDRERFLSACGF